MRPCARSRRRIAWTSTAWSGRAPGRCCASTPRPRSAKTARSRSSEPSRGADSCYHGDPNAAGEIRVMELAQVEAWAREAGAIGRGYYNAVEVRRKADRSVVTAADIEIEQ